MRRGFQQHLLQIEFRAPLPEAREELLDSVRERVVEELGRTVDALGRFDDVRAQHFATLGLADPHHHEVRDREDERREVPEARHRERAHVLDLVRLLHEANRLLDAPPREVALDDAPDVLLRAVALQRREDEHRALPEAAHDDEPQVFLVHAGEVGVLRKAHRHRAVVDRRVLLLAVGVERDDRRVGRVAHCREDEDVRPHALVHEVALLHHAHDEVEPARDEIAEYLVAVSAAVVDVDAAVADLRADRVDDGLDLRVLALVLGIFRRPEPELERDDAATLAGLAGDRHAAPVAEVVADPALRAVPHLREELHLLRVGLLHVGRVDDDQRRLADELLRVFHHRLVNMPPEVLEREVVTEPHLDFHLLDVFVYFRRDLVQNDRFRDLDAVQHLPQKLEARLRKTGVEYTQKLFQLLTRIRRNFGIISHAATSWFRFFLQSYIIR